MIHSGVIDRGGQGMQLLYSDPNFNTQWGYFRAAPPLAADYFVADYHVVSAYWSMDDMVTIYVDGVPITQHRYRWVHANGTDAGYAHVLLNLAMGGQWPTAGWSMPMTTEPQQFIVDYVRVFQTPTMPPTTRSVVGRDFCPAEGSC